MENIYLENLKTMNTSDLANDLSSMISSYYDSRYYQIATLSIAYILYNAKNMNCNANLDEISLNGNISQKLKNIIEKYTINVKDGLNAYKEKYTADQLLSFILFNSDFDSKSIASNNTPNGISKLAIKILNIHDENSVLDLCSGTSNFIIECFKEHHLNKYVGIELDFINNEISELRKDVLKMNSEYIQSDVFQMEHIGKYDCVFSNYPFQVRMPNMAIYKDQICQKLGMNSDLLKRASSDWVYNSVVLNYMNDDAKAVAIMTNGSTWNKTDQNIRKFFVENGYIEAVIALPSKLFSSTSIATTMIVFSKNNKSIRMIDATRLCEEQRRNNILRDQDIDEILALLENDTELSVNKTLDDIANNDYIINPIRYLEILPDIKNGVEFGTIIKEITRGSQLKATELESLKSDKPTDYKSFMLSNIKNGLVDFEEVQYLNDIPEKYEKYCILDNSIVLSKIGSPNLKSAVVNVENGKKVLATGNLFVIKLDESKADPYYVQSFFMSELGVATFNNILSGAFISSISIDKLKKIIIPLPEMSVQKEIATRYKATIDEINYLNTKLKKANSKLNHVFDMGELNC